jgi:hypothetical protein
LSIPPVCKDMCAAEEKRRKNRGPCRRLKRPICFVARNPLATTYFSEYLCSLVFARAAHPDPLILLNSLIIGFFSKLLGRKMIPSQSVQVRSVQSKTRAAAAYV